MAIVSRRALAASPWQGRNPCLNFEQPPTDGVSEFEGQRELAPPHHGVDRAVLQADAPFHFAPRNESIFRSWCRHSVSVDRLGSPCQCI